MAITLTLALTLTLTLVTHLTHLTHPPTFSNLLTTLVTRLPIETLVTSEICDSMHCHNPNVNPNPNPDFNPNPNPNPNPSPEATRESDPVGGRGALASRRGKRGLASSREAAQGGWRFARRRRRE